MKKEMLSKLLINQKEELSERITKISVDLSNRSKNRIADQQGIDHTNDDVLIALQNEAQTKLDMTQIALHRLEKGEFGFCVECGSDINDERLKSLPHTQICRVCANKEEGGGRHNSSTAKNA